MLKFAALYLILGVTCTFGHPEATSQGQEYGVWGDSGIIGPKYTSILSQFDELAKKYSAVATWMDYGKTTKGRPLKLLTVFKPSTFSEKRPTFVMSGSTHGNEYLNLEDRIPEEILKLSIEGGSVGSFIEKGGAFVFIPILNPDGYEARQRENANGVDLNRDWDVPAANFKGFKEIESRLLADKLEALTKAPYNFNYKVTVDYHCCIGAILYPWSYKATPIPQLEITKHMEIADVADKHLKIDHGTTAQILGYYALGTTKDYYYSKYGSMAFTFEGRYGEENKNLTKHISWWKEMVGLVSDATYSALLSLKKAKPHAFIKIAD